MSNNNNNNNNVPPKRPRKRHRWWYGNNNGNANNNGSAIGNKHQKIDSSPPPPTPPLVDKLKNLENERLENQKQVANMEKQLHEYFHKTNTPYTYVDDTGVYKFTPAPAPPPPPAAPPAEPSAPANPFMNLTFNPFIPSTATPSQVSSLFSMPLLWPSPFNAPTTETETTPAATATTAQTPAAAEITEVFINEDINHIDDLIALCDKYPLSDTVKYNINMTAIHAIRGPLTDLTNMIGMDTIKKTIVDQILYYLQELHVPVGQSASTASTASMPAPPAPPAPVLNPFTDQFPQPLFDFKTLNQRISENIKKKMSECGGGGGGGGGDPINSADFAAPTKGDFMHTVICGPPGSGKTEVAKIIGRIFSNLGILTKKTFKKVSRNDLVAGYLGQTAIKTKDIIKASIGGVLFIDEAYSLGNSEKRDSFAKECVDTLCEALSEHKHNWMVIIAGYEKELNDCFFSLNEGLNSRFTWRFKLDNYKPGELKSIYEKQVRDFGWTIAAAGAVSDKHGHRHGLRDEWFAEHMDYFTSYGRDMETLFTKTKIAHSRRVFCLPLSAKTEITMTDLENGFKLFIENPEVKERKERGSGGSGSYMKTLYL
jgi:nicotinamide riboside kinase